MLGQGMWTASLALWTFCWRVPFREDLFLPSGESELPLGSSDELIIVNHGREFLQPRHRARFDALVSSSMTTPSRRKSVDETVRTRSLGDTRCAKSPLTASFSLSLTHTEVLLGPPVYLHYMPLSVEDMRSKISFRKISKFSHPTLSLSLLLPHRLVKVDRSGGGFGISLSGNAPVFIRAVDEGGPAQLAGLRAGDTLLAINGLNVR